MFKDLVNAPSNEEFSKIVFSSSTVNEVAAKLGFVHSPGLGSRHKINARIVHLNLKLGSSIVEAPKQIFERKEFNENIEGFSKFKGDISELSVQLEMANSYLRISKPIFENCPYDLVMEYNGKLYKVQVKTARIFKNGTVHADLGRTTMVKNKTYRRKGYTKDEVDIFAIHCIDTGTNCYVINNGEISRISFRQKDFIRQHNEHIIENFSLDRLLESLRTEE